MAVETVNAGGIFHIGGVLRRAWRLLAGDILFFLAVSVLIYAATMVASHYAAGVLVDAIQSLPGAVRAGPEWVAGVGIFVGIILPLNLNMVGQAVPLLRASQRPRGQPRGAAEAPQKMLARAVPLLELILLWGLGLSLCLVSCVILLSLALWGFAGAELMRASPYLYLSLVPLLTLLVPTAILLVLSAVVVPACVVERLGPLASMVRSIALTKRHRWKILGIMLLQAVLTAGGQIIDQLVAPDHWSLAILVDAVWSVPLIAYWNATIIMTYRDLRVAKEDADTGQIAAIFD